MTLVERAIRLIAFFAGFGALIAWTGLRMLGPRLSSLVAPAAAARTVRGMQRRWSRASVAWARAAAGMRVRVEGAPPAGAGLVIVCNHQSLIDIPLLIATLPDAVPLFVLKSELKWGIPNISPAARLGGHAFVSRKRMDRKQFQTIERLGRQVTEDGVSAVIFPEGTRSRDGRLGAFKPAGLAKLLRAAPGARVVPVAIDGTWRAATFKGLLTGLPGMDVRVRVGDAISGEAEGIVERCKVFCEKALGEWRGGDGAR